MNYRNTRDYPSAHPDTMPGDLARLEDMKDWEIADGETDPRGYDLVGADGEKMGTIESLLVSPTTKKAHFALVKCGPWLLQKRHLVPLESLQFLGNHASAPFPKDLLAAAPEWQDDGSDIYRYYRYWNSASTLSSPALSNPANAGNSVVIPVIEEDMQIGKRQTQRSIRVSQRVTERPVEETVQLREERLQVERRPADRALTAGDREVFRNGDFTLTAASEEAVVEKSPRVVEEVVVGKQSASRMETVHDTVRRMEVDVDEDEAVVEELKR